MHAKMKVSSKGQVVLPKAMRTRLGMVQGSEVEAVDVPGGIILRPLVSRTGPSAAEVLARIWARSPYTGPVVTDEDIEQAAMQAAAERYAKL